MLVDALGSKVSPLSDLNGSGIMFWAKRKFAYADYARYQDLLAKLQLANAARYPEFIMVSTQTADPGVSEYYIGVPYRPLLSMFDGFEPVDEDALPKVIDVLHLADATKEPFKSRFRFAHSEMR
jgi:hypothetical protein